MAPSAWSMKIILGFLRVKRQPFLRCWRQLLYVNLHDLIQFLRQNHASSRLPKPNLLHIRCLMPKIHHWCFIWIIFFISKVLSLIIDGSAGVVPLRPTICGDNVRISSGSIGRIIHFGNFLAQRLRNNCTWLRP